MLRGISFERVESLLTHVSAYKFQKGLEMGNFRTNNAAKGGPRGMRGGGGGGQGGVLGGMSPEQAKRARKGFEGGIVVKVAGIISAVP